MPPLLDQVRAAAAPAAFEHRDGTNSGVVAFNNTRMAEIDLENWALAAARAAGGAVYGDQDLLNLMLGRRDIDVHYLPPRFNVQLAYPHRQTDAFMADPWCARDRRVRLPDRAATGRLCLRYGQAQFAAAAAGRAAFGSSSFGHFIWTRKPWTPHVDGELHRIYEAIRAGGRPGLRYVVLASPAWVNAWRAFAVEALGADHYAQLFKMHPRRRVVEFALLARKGEPGSPHRCIGARAVSCGAARSSNDTGFPAPFRDFFAVAAAVPRIPRRDRGEPPDPAAERVLAHHANHSWSGFTG